MIINSNELQVKHLLKADPFGQVTTVINSDNSSENRLVEDAKDFFSHIYEEADGKIVINDQEADYNIDKWLSLNNNFKDEPNCMLFFIEGYAGCGKSTLVQHILYTILDNQQYEYSYYNYDVGNFPEDNDFTNKKETNFIKSSIFFGLKNQIIHIFKNKNSKKIFEKFEMLMNDEKSLKSLDGSLEIGMKFGNSLAFLTAVKKIYKNEKNTENILLLKRTIESQMENFNTYQLLCIDYLWRLAQYLADPKLFRKYMYVCYDNLDSIMNYDVLCNFKDQLSYFRYNLSNYIAILNHNIKYGYQTYGVDKINTFVIFSTYRKITAIRSNNRHNEMLDDLLYNSQYVIFIEVSKQYNFMKIADKRIKHFTAKLRSTNICHNTSELIRQMKAVKQLQKMIFVKNTYSGLWNNNLRSCSNVLNNLIVYNKHDIDRCIELYTKDKFDGHIPERYCYYGASSLFLHAVCKMLKEIGIFGVNFLDLVNIKEDAQKKKTSLSRLLITYIYTEDRSVSITELFYAFDKVFEPRYICKILGQLLTRAKGEIWRRPIYYSKHALYNETDITDKLYDQYLKYKKGEVYKYVEFKICDCGKTYIDAIVPHFEFYSIRINEQYKSVYCVDDLKELILILDSVYEKIEVCCEKQMEFSQKYIKEYRLTKSKYITRPFHPKTRIGKPQLHIERVIFSHIAYLNNYRWYLMLKKKNKYLEFNEKLIDYIEKYLKLYDMLVKPISDSRNSIANKMFDKVKLARNNPKFISIETENKSCEIN